MVTGTVAYFSPFVPPEWIAAHGLRPHRLVPGASGGAAGAGACPFAHDFLRSASARGAAGAVVFAGTCDPMRRAPERMPGAVPAFLLHVPATWQTPEALALYVAELERLSGFLVGLGGARPGPDALASVMLDHDAARRRAAGRPAVVAGIRVALAGGPLRRQDAWIAGHILGRGGAVVLDATETGERTLPAPFSREAVLADPVRELARAYFLGIPDVFRRPDSLLHDYLRRETGTRRVQGLLLVRCVWCDLWHAQAARLKETLGIPVVEIDLGEDDHDLPRVRTRIDALLDVLR